MNMATFTQNFNLNQWQGDDPVRRVDFNADNEKVDAALSHLVKENCLISLGEYYTAEKVKYARISLADVNLSEISCLKMICQVGGAARKIFINGDESIKYFYGENTSGNNRSFSGLQFTEYLGKSTNDTCSEVNLMRSLDEKHIMMTGFSGAGTLLRSCSETIIAGYVGCKFEEIEFLEFNELAANSRIFLYGLLRSKDTPVLLTANVK